MTSASIFVKVGFVGRGGGGKTTLAAEYIRYVYSQFGSVAAFDCDVNAHMKDALGLEGSLISLHRRFEEVRDFLEGARDDFRKLGLTTCAPPFGPLPPHARSHFIQGISDPFYARFALIEQGITLVEAGKHDPADTTSSCYHGLLKAAVYPLFRLARHHQGDVILDCTADKDLVATTLFMVPDLLVFVLDPTQEAVQAFLDFKRLVSPYGVTLSPVGNKVENEADRQFIRKALPGEEILGFVDFDKTLRKVEQGKTTRELFGKHNIPLFTAIRQKAVLCAQTRDWDQFTWHTSAMYIHKCHWWSEYLHVPLLNVLPEYLSYAGLSRFCGSKKGTHR